MLMVDGDESVWFLVEDTFSCSIEEIPVIESDCPPAHITHTI